MAYKIITNKPGTKTVLRIYGNTNFSVNTLSVGATEIVGAASLTQVFHSSNGGTSTVYWRANTSVANNACWRMISGESGYTDFAGVGVGADVDLRTANIIFVVPDASTTIIAEFHKESNLT